MIPETKYLNMLGLARRAGRVVSGEFSTEKAVKTGKACLVLVASDASENTKKMFLDMCSFRGVPVRTGPEKAVLGHAIGQEMRASLAVTDEQFARAIEKIMDENNNGGSENGGAE